MNLSQYFEKFGRTLLERPLSTSPHPDDPPELAEVRHAVLDEVRQKCYRAGAKKVFPYNLIQVSMRGVESSRAALFGTPFFRQFLEQEIRRSLQTDGTRFPEDLSVEVAVSTGIPQPGEVWLTVAAASRDQAGPGAKARLRIARGISTTPELILPKARTNVGREVDVYRSGGLHRRNDLAFVEDDEINRSVSREHAHIDYEAATNDYRLFNDRWYERGADCGLRIVRRGMSIEVHRDSRGARLEPGDEIHFGRAVVLFQVE
jgi:hypothetical protein